MWLDGTDYRDIQEALDVFMTGVRETLRKEKENLLIEFRQCYSGPLSAAVLLDGDIEVDLGFRVVVS